MYAVVDIKGFQYKLSKGDKLRVPKYDLEIGKKVTIPEVLLVAGDKDVKVGTPYVDGAVVVVTVVGQGKYEKVTVFKKKRRKDSAVKKGHRQEFTEIEVHDIKVAKKSASKAAKKKEKEAEKTVEAQKAVEAPQEEAAGAAEAPQEEAVEKEVKAEAPKKRFRKKKTEKAPKEEAAKDSPEEGSEQKASEG